MGWLSEEGRVKREEGDMGSTMVVGKRPRGSRRSGKVGCGSR